MPKTKIDPVVSAAQEAARNRGFKGNAELAEQFGINDNFQREVVKVDHLPDPPDTIVVQAAEKKKGKKASTSAEALEISAEDMAARIIKDEIDELAFRLDRIGVPFDAKKQQELFDYGVALISGMGGGGTLARRAL